MLLPFHFRKLKSGNMLVVNQGGEFLILNRQEFDSLLNADRQKISSDLYTLFRSKQFVGEKKEKELDLNLLAIKLRTRKSFLVDFTSLHMMVLTVRYNCICDYYHASSADLERKNSDMTWDIAKTSIDLIFQSPSKDIKIEFQGGKPLLNWGVLQKSVLYAEERNKKLGNKCRGFVVCTNLMLMDESKLTFCRDHKIDISTSLDGPMELHDLHRKTRDGSSSYLKFLEKLSEARRVCGEKSVNALLTVTKDHLPLLKETIDEYIRLGFGGVFLRALNPYGYARENMSFVGYSMDDFDKAYKEALDYIVSLNQNGKHFIELWLSL